jgi:hypothetical protein
VRCRIDAVRLDFVRVSPVSQAFNVSLKAELRSQLSAQHCLLTAVCCSSHGIECPFVAVAIRDGRSRLSWRAGRIRYKVNTRISVMFPTRDDYFRGFFRP